MHLGAWARVKRHCGAWGLVLGRRSGGTAQAVLATWVLCLLREVKGSLKKKGRLNEAGCEGLAGISQAEMGNGEERELCSTLRERHEPKLRGESAKYI